MGKKGSWISAVKKALSPECKGKKDKKSHKSKSKWFGKHKSPNSGSPPATPTQEVKLAKAENEQNKHACSAALATAMAAEAAVAAAQAAAEVVRLRAAVHYSGKSKEEVAATKIQTAFRGYLARRALRTLRGLARLKSLIHGPSVKRQATTTLRCMQTMARVQSQIRARRIRMSEENETLQRQLQQKCEKELEKFRASVEDDWNASVRSKEQIEANLQNKQEAAMRRERALAYAYSHRQVLKSSSKSANHKTFMDPSYPHWGWSWLERWMASRPWQNENARERELYSDHASIKRATAQAFPVRELGKSRSHRDLNRKNIPSPTALTPSRQSPSTNASRAPSVSSKGGGRSGGGEDSRSMLSFQSEWYHRRHSIAGSSARDDESLASSPSVPRYMGPTESAKAKTRPYRIPSPLGNGTPEKGSAGSAKKRLSFSSSPAGIRRHSGPPKLDISVHSEKKPSNGGGR
ncbi:protein IQ-DOMAIN 3-like isoform X2 [Rhododendron vialii]|uniref:protein IQ-DOMAIN 3-like isoform X2 n=1 Tax=Rhododendron vialii TaxID=182163 RepID=UPI00265DB5C4|nr:protein IQ-DOMAIN 3-like isoform X2 [Rhododendron vialii]